MIPEIKCTIDYSLFKFWDINRRISKKNNLSKSINDLDLTMFVPIIVDSKHRIIDGQHRFMACMELNKPIYYVVIPDYIAERAMVVLNATQRMWRREEFLHYFAGKNIGSCKEIEDFCRDNNWQLSNALVVYPLKQNNGTGIRKGNFVIEKNPKVDAIVQFMAREEIKRLKFSNTRSFVLAVRHAFDRYTPRQLDKLARKSLIIPMCANYEQYLTVFENIIKK